MGFINQLITGGAPPCMYYMEIFWDLWTYLRGNPWGNCNKGTNNVFLVNIVLGRWLVYHLSSFTDCNSEFVKHPSFFINQPMEICDIYEGNMPNFHPCSLIFYIHWGWFCWFTIQILTLVIYRKFVNHEGYPVLNSIARNKIVGWTPFLIFI